MLYAYFCIPESFPIKFLNFYFLSLNCILFIICSSSIIQVSDLVLSHTPLFPFSLHLFCVFLSLHSTLLSLSFPPSLYLIQRGDLVEFR